MEPGTAGQILCTISGKTRMQVPRVLVFVILLFLLILVRDRLALLASWHRVKII